MSLFIAILDSNGNVIARQPLDERGPQNAFSSGSVGYFFGGKIALPSTRPERSADAPATHQVTCSVVETHTKGLGKPVVKPAKASAERNESAT